MRHLLAGLALALLSIQSATHAAGPTRERLEQLGSLERCEQTSPGHVVYQGESAGLRACLDKFALTEIGELRVTSPGGEAWGTLDIAQRFAGRIDRLVADGLCASSCDLIPAARW